MESIETLEALTMKEIKKTKAYLNCSISLPGIPKSQMKKNDLLQLLKKDQKIRQIQIQKTKTRREERKPYVPFVKDVYFTNPIVKDVYFTEKQKNDIVTRLEKIAIEYERLDNPKQFAFLNVAYAIKIRPVLSLNECRQLKGVGPAIFTEIKLAVNGNPSKRLQNLQK